MIQIKKTKALNMVYDEDCREVWLFIYRGNDPKNALRILIPAKYIFQVQRGITSVIQRFYRKAKK
jgi:hypothetical protein